jgi:uncharacterized repeat protein (TIGR01451 family)
MSWCDSKNTCCIIADLKQKLKKYSPPPILENNQVTNLTLTKKHTITYNADHPDVTYLTFTIEATNIGQTNLTNINITDVINASPNEIYDTYLVFTSNSSILSNSSTLSNINVTFKLLPNQTFTITVIMLILTREITGFTNTANLIFNATNLNATTIVPTI